MIKDLREKYIYILEDNSVLNSDHHTRSTGYILPQFQRLSVTQRSITFNGPTIWNSIPLIIRQSQSLKIFKRTYKAHILSKYI